MRNTCRKRGASLSFTIATALVSLSWSLPCPLSGAESSDAGAGSRQSLHSEVAPPANTVHIQCYNNLGDASLIQDAVRNHAAVKVTGICNLGTATISVDSGVYLGGSAILRYSGSGYALTSSGDNNTVTGLTFEGGGINLNKKDEANGTGQSGWTIQGNTFRDITNGTSAVYVSYILGKGAPSSISYNSFVHIWPGGYPTFPAGYSASNCGQDCLLGNGSGGSGVWVEMGLDNVVIDYNSFDTLAGNAIKGFWDGFMGKIHPYHGHNVEISHNVMTRIHRIGIEVQTVGKGVCQGGCNYSLIPNDGVVINDNFFHLPAFTADPFGFSLMVGGTHVQILNNTAVDEDPVCYWPLGIGLENTMNGGLIQGNVVRAVYQNCSAEFNRSHGWAGILVSGYTTEGYRDDFFNNVACGDGRTGPTLVSDDPDNHATMNERADYGAAECPTDVASSKITMAFTSLDRRSFSTTGSARFEIALTSTLSIQNVRFFVDRSRTPVAIQEVQDFNPEFSKDPQWLYHATINLSSLKPGPHTVTAVATDVAGGEASLAQSFVAEANRAN